MKHLRQLRRHLSLTITALDSTHRAAAIVDYASKVGTRDYDPKILREMIERHQLAAIDYGEAAVDFLVAAENFIESLEEDDHGN